MIERGQQLRFTFEARHPSGVLSEQRRKNSDGDVATKARVAAAVDLAHVALPNERQHFVLREPRAGGGGSCWATGLSGVFSAHGSLDDVILPLPRLATLQALRVVLHSG